jgi:hypothetical protein
MTRDVCESLIILQQFWRREAKFTAKKQNLEDTQHQIL